MPDLQTEIQTLLDKLRNLVAPLLFKITPPRTEQAISMPDIYNRVVFTLDSQSQADSIYRRLIDCYLDGEGMYAVIAIEGKLYRSALTMKAGTVNLGDLQEVEIDYKPVAQAFKVMQQADGSYRWFAFPAATAVLNRNGYLNSRQLYDNFKKHILNRDSPMPYLTFYHVGEALVMGQADMVEREGYTLLVSGTFNDTPLAQALAKSGEFDGVSIGYYRNPEAVQTIQVDDAVTIPVDTDGVLLEISSMREEDAACLMTVFATKGVNQMNQYVLDELKKLAGDNPAAIAQVEALADNVDQINQTIEADNLVRQAQAQSGTTPPPTVPPSPVEPATIVPSTELAADSAIPSPEPTGEAQEINLTDEAVQAIAERVRSGFAAELAVIQTVQVEQATIQDKVDKLAAAIDELKSRLDELEKSDQVKVSQALSDMPRNTLTVGYRPSKPVVTAPSSDEPDTDSIANDTLAKIRAGQKKS